MASRLVPWVAWEEWDEVGRWLLSPKQEANRQGLSRVAAWRCRGRVPVAVEATAEVVEIGLQESDPAGTHSEQSLRALYAMSLVRLVNGVADQGQRGRYAASVASLAESVGLPRLLVDIRHESAHNELPALPLLRLAAKQALSWLEINYWAAQREYLLTADTLLQSKLVGFATQQLTETPSKKRTTEPKVDESKKKRKKTADLPDKKVKEVADMALNQGSAVVAAMLDKGLLSSIDNGSTNPVSRRQWESAIRCLCGKVSYFGPLFLAGVMQRLLPREPLKLPSDNPQTLATPELFRWAKWLLEQSSANTRLRGNPRETQQEHSWVLPRDCIRSALRACQSCPVSSGHLAAISSLLAHHLVDHGGNLKVRQKLAVLAGLTAPLEVLEAAGEDDADLGTLREGKSKRSHEEGILDALDKGLQEAQAHQAALFRRKARGSPQPETSKGPWSLAQDWRPCGIGMSPSLLHPMGVLPSLEWPPSHNQSIGLGESDDCRERVAEPEVRLISAELHELIPVEDTDLPSTSLELEEEQAASVPSDEQASAQVAEGSANDKAKDEVGRLKLKGVLTPITREEVLRIQQAIRLF